MRTKILRPLLILVAGLLLGAAITATAQKTSTVTTSSGAVTAYAKPKTASELSLRLTGHHGHHVVGTLMAKVDGEWREVELASQNVLAK